MFSLNRLVTFNTSVFRFSSQCPPAPVKFAFPSFDNQFRSVSNIKSKKVRLGKEEMRLNLQRYLKSQSKSQPSQIEKNLDFETFKIRYCKTFDEYKAFIIKHFKDHKSKNLKELYESYCKSRYNAYKTEGNPATMI